jgi:hypothetical protein
MIETLKTHLNETNSHLIKHLSRIIKNNHITSMEELIEFENKQFTIDGKLLDKEGRIKYASKMALQSYWDYDNLDSIEEINYVSDLKESLKQDISDEEKIYNIIKLFDIVGNECLFVSDAYKLIVEGKI